MARYFLGMTLQQMGRFKPAIELFRAALQQMPAHSEAHYNLGLALQVTGNISEAIRHYRAAIKLRDDYAEPRNNLAWILATHPDPRYRNPREAVQLVQRANDIAQNQNAGILDTLSAAHAAAGNFELAVATADLAISLARQAGNQKFAEILQSRLDLYRQGKPYIDGP